MKNDHDRIEALLNQVPEFKPDEQIAFLAEACGKDHDLRQKAEPYYPVNSRIGNRKLK